MSSPVDVTPISSRESAETKGRRYLVEGRLSVKRVHNGFVIGTCRGDQGDVYTVGYSRQRKEWRCDCPARGRCAHIVAIALVVEKSNVSERLLTARELGEMLGLSPSTVLDRFERGDLPGFRLYGGRVGAPVRFRWSEVEAMLEQGRCGPEVARRPVAVP